MIATSAEEAQIPHSFLCPITQSLLIDPVIASDGFTYERSAIERWFRTSDKSPVTGVNIKRLIFPNLALRGAIRELYPDKVGEQRPPQTSTSTESVRVEISPTETFTKSREQILEACRLRYPAPPRPGTVYFGLFEQQFVRGEDIATSRWTVRAEFDSLDQTAPLPVLTAILTWRKHEQVFEPDMNAFSEHGFATRLLNTVGKTFDCKVRGTFSPTNGVLDMYTYDGTTVGIGYYKLILGSDTLDGCFFLPDLEDTGNPTTQGMGILRMILEQQ